MVLKRKWTILLVQNEKISQYIWPFGRKEGDKNYLVHLVQQLMGNNKKYFRLGRFYANDEVFCFESKYNSNYVKVEPKTMADH